MAPIVACVALVLVLLGVVLGFALSELRVPCS